MNALHITLYAFVYKTSYCIYIASYVISDIHWLNKWCQCSQLCNNGCCHGYYQQWLPWLLPTMVTMATTNNAYHGYYQQWLPWLLLTMFTTNSTNNGYHDYYQQWLLHMWKILRVKILQLHNEKNFHIVMTYHTQVIFHSLI